jgi:hypothetical protein
MRIVRLLDAQSNVVDVVVPPEGRITVVGDIHGQLEDLLTIFKLNGITNSQT